MLEERAVKIRDFHYDFPEDQIGLEKEAKRSQSRMLVYDRQSQEIKHSRFIELSEFLRPTDLLVVNTTKVLPARFRASRKTGGNLEGLFLEGDDQKSLVWLKGKVQPGELILLGGQLEAEVLKREEARAWLKISAKNFESFLWESGEVPIPPYIRAARRQLGFETSEEKDRENYQSRFAKNADLLSAAAPTASLHFDEELIQKIKTMGVEIQEICLRVGEGTFAPVRAETLEAHEMHHEEVAIAPEVWREIKSAKSQGRRVIAVGTTVVRSLEAAARREEAGERVDSFSTDLFIRPPFEFKIVDGLVTNFHWPDSTLIVLAATFMEATSGACPEEIQHRWKKVYAEGISAGYRLFSYGDGMFLI